MGWGDQCTLATGSALIRVSIHARARGRARLAKVKQYVAEVKFQSTRAPVLVAQLGKLTESRAAS